MTKTEQLIESARRHLTLNYKQAPVVLSRGEGVWLWDVDGNRYLDMTAGIAVCGLGHAHPRLVQAIGQDGFQLLMEVVDVVLWGLGLLRGRDGHDRLQRRVRAEQMPPGPKGYRKGTIPLNF